MEQPYGPPPARQAHNLALASLITGIAVLLVGCCLPFIGPFTGIPLGIVAIILGVMALNAVGRSDTEPDSSKTMAVIGIVLGAFALLLGIGSGIWFYLVYKNMAPNLPGFPGGRPPIIP